MAHRKNPAAVALGRKGGKKGGPARAAKLTAAERRESARNAVQARWTKAKKGKDDNVVKPPQKGAKTFSQFQKQINEAPPVTGTSDEALLSLLKHLKATNDPTEVRQLSDQIERVIFHKQFQNT